MIGSSRPSPHERDSMFGAVMSVPAEIFAVGGGTKDIAQSVSEVAGAANRGVNSIDTLPLNARLQTELLLFRLDEDPAVQKLLSDISRVSKAIADAGMTVNDLPDRVESTVARTIREAESTQPEFRKTLAEGREVVSEARAAVDKAGSTIDKLGEEGWVERTTANAVAAGDAWKGAFEQINLLANPPRDPDAPPPEPAPPFDIKDAARTAEWATKAAQEVRGTVVEARGILEGDRLDERIRQFDATTRSALEGTASLAGGLLYRATFCAALLIVFFFAALFGYRYLVARTPRLRR